MPSHPSVAIIGAGIAGLTCGTALKGMVPHLKVFEKAYSPAGVSVIFVRVNSNSITARSISRLIIHCL
jgi:cation diffusion facilitator CzcD-associated flavoprotein CzcO